MENKEIIKALCDVVTTFGLSQLDASGNLMYRFNVQIEDPIEGGIDDMSNVESNFIKFITSSVPFTRDSVSDIEFSYSLSIFNDEAKLLPDDVSLLVIRVPGPSYDRLMGKDSTGRNLKVLDKNVNPNPRTIRISLWPEEKK